MKQFLIILGLTALVWLGVSMSEENTYTLHTRVVMVGYDTVRYAVVRADTAVVLRVQSNGYNALLRSVGAIRPRLTVDMADRQAVATSELCEQAMRQIPGILSATCDADSLRLLLAERAHRQYRPVTDDVKFSFADRYGLYGEPSVSPSVITLYGPAADLDRIGELHLEATSIDGISASGTYRIKVQPVWEQYADVKPSTTEVDVYVPVEAYVEREYKVPIRVADADSTEDLRIYPPEASVHVWVAQRDLERQADFTVSIDYADVVAHNRLVPRLTQFPTHIRPRSVEPAEVQCVIIK